MKLKYQHIVVLTLLMVLFGACSVKKNTWSTRTYQAINTRFNVYFNGTTAFEEGMRNISNANKEDYSTIIPMYPISKHDNANSAQSNMDRTIEKCRKAIKLHSIKQKPERNVKKWSDPEYQLWYKQEEFNPVLKDVWLLLAKAEFHKADFIGSVGTFTYIARHYANDKDVVARCQLWIARAYGEMGWIYEAEQVLSKLKQDDLKPQNAGLFASVNADLLLKKHQYKEAIPFLEIALKKETDKVQKQRFNFLLAQLYKKTGSNKEAYDAFTRVIKLNPSFEMDFNARIYRAELENKNVGSVRKELNKMLKNQNNKDYLDQIYFALGKTYLQNKDTAKAIDFFNQSVEKSTRNGFDKALTLITLGDLFYQKKAYIKAQPCYDEASKIITVDHEDYARVSKLAETLSELVVQHEIVVLQDSLQYLSTLSESKRLEVVNKLIEKLIADEKVAAELEKSKSEQQNRIDDFEPMTPIGASTGSGDWYFYNSTLVKSGQTDFQKKWGRRKLEDNWRRINKTSTLFADENVSAGSSQSAESTGDTTSLSASTVTDDKTPEFYLRQIPVTPAQLAKSNAEIATALFNMGMIYKEKVEDFPMAIKTFDEFARRFPADKRKVETYFQSYMLETKNGNPVQAEVYRNKLLQEFPDSKYAEVLSQPDYLERMARMYREQDSLYNVTYTAYNASDFRTVKKNTEYIQQNYPLSDLMPKFLFLNALSIGKTDKPEIFEKALNAVVEKFPESDVSAMSKDILALIKQGREAKTGTSHGTLLSRREEVLKEEAAQQTGGQFSSEKATRHRLMIVTGADKELMNKLLYNIAAYNFTRFMVKDFDLVTAKLDSTQNTLSITNFESYDETEWYVNSIESDASLSALLNEMNARKVIISEQNYGLIRTLFGLDEYLAYQSKYLSGKTSVTGKTLANATQPVSLSMKKDIAPKQTTPAVATPSSATPQMEKKPVKTDESMDVTRAKNTTPVRTPATVQPKEENVPLFKNLFAYKPNDPHYVSIAVLSGTFDFDKLKTAFDAYNAQNYGMLNLKINKETVGKMQVIIIGSFADANLAKSYLIRMVKERSLFDNLKGTDYRNLLGTQKNLNVVMQQNVMNTYFEFMQEYYLK